MIGEKLVWVWESGGYIWATMWGSWPCRRSGRRGLWAEGQVRQGPVGNKMRLQETCGVLLISTRPLLEDTLQDWYMFIENLVCSWLTWSRTDAIEALEVHATGETKPEHPVANANSSRCAMNTGRRGKGSECIARRAAFRAGGFLFLTFTFLILKIPRDSSSCSFNKHWWNTFCSSSDFYLDRY